MDDNRYRSRKFIIAALTMAASTLVMFASVWGVYPDVVMVMPVLTWWAGVAGGVITLYGATNIIDKKKNGES